MTSPIAIQLYSVRELMAKDFTGVVEKIAQVGYAGVETATFPGITPETAGHLFTDLGLSVVAAHLPLPLGEKKNEVLEIMAAIGCSRLVCASQPIEGFKTLDGIQRTAQALNEAQAVAAENGMAFFYHNHWWEYQPVENRLAYDILREYVNPNVLFEIDTYWVKTAGVDPAGVVRALGRRAPLLHIKDGPCVMNQPMTAVGAGVMDIPSVIKAGAGFTEWLIVEIDSIATDVMEAVEQSYRYLVGKGLGHGTKN